MVLKYTSHGKVVGYNGGIWTSVCHSCTNGTQCFFQSSITFFVLYSQAGSFLLSIIPGTYGIITTKEKRNSLYKMNELQRQSAKPWSRKYAHAICKVHAYFDFKLHNRFICHFLFAIRSKFLGFYVTFLCNIIKCSLTILLLIN